MGKSSAEKNRLRGQIRRCETIIKALQGVKDKSSRDEVTRQKQMVKNLKYELDHG